MINGFTKRSLLILWRAFVIVAGITFVWQIIVTLSNAPPYILPSPMSVFATLYNQFDLIIINALVTITEILLGLLFGTVLGVCSAIVVVAFKPARLWLLPILVASQAIPVFAIAPLLVLWLGYGVASKIGMATLIIFFPVTANFLDGLRRTEPGWLDLANTMTIRNRRSMVAVLLYIRIPAALPALASGIRVAAAVAPIGAIVGEWVGAGAGLGYLMLQANAKVQIDLMFAALLVITIFSVCLYFSIDKILKILISWQPDNLPDSID